MSEFSRNDLCPCGSGKKYKKCCLQKDQLFAERWREEGRAVTACLAWLWEHHAEAVEDAVQGGFLGGLDDDEVDRLNDLPADVRDMLDTNIGEWLLNDAEFEVDGRLVRARELLFAPGGPLLTAQGRQWIEALAEKALSLYEVIEVKAGEGLRVKDALRPDEAPVWVVERSASRSLVRGDVIGARLARWHDGAWALSGAAYPLSREDANQCRARILRDMKGEDWDSGLARDLIGGAISFYWLQSLLVAQGPRGGPRADPLEHAP